MHSHWHLMSHVCLSLPFSLSLSLWVFEHKQTFRLCFSTNANASPIPPISTPFPSRVRAHRYWTLTVCSASTEPQRARDGGRPIRSNPAPHPLDQLDQSIQKVWVYVYVHLHLSIYLSIHSTSYLAISFASIPINAMYRAWTSHLPANNIMFTKGYMFFSTHPQSQSFICGI